nr:PREDICTED: uncharacterized protein LOC108219040 isoform X1 [Daucus carota subsp. sativus]
MPSMAGSLLRLLHYSTGRRRNMGACHVLALAQPNGPVKALFPMSFELSFSSVLSSLSFRGKGAEGKGNSVFSNSEAVKSLSDFLNSLLPFPLPTDQNVRMLFRNWCPMLSKLSNMEANTMKLIWLLGHSAFSSRKMWVPPVELLRSAKVCVRFKWVVGYWI